MNGPSDVARVGVVGSCQVVGLAATFKSMWPNADVKRWFLGPQCPDSHESIAEQLSHCDLAVSQVEETDPAAPLSFRRLRETTARAVYVPKVVFNGFHPDCVYLEIDGTPIAGPCVLLHSAIIAAGYVLGLPAARVASLFNAPTYSSLGYFEAFDVARGLLTETFVAAGFDIGRSIDGWLAKAGVFMHTVNHPHICVLSELAHTAAVRAGMADTSSKVPDGVQDWLAHSVTWPVYLELARELALTSGDLVVRMTSRTLDREPEHMRELPEMVSAFYAVYAQQDRVAFQAAVPARVLAGLEDVLTA